MGRRKHAENAIFRSRAIFYSGRFSLFSPLPPAVCWGSYVFGNLVFFQVVFRGFPLCANFRFFNGANFPVIYIVFFFFLVKKTPNRNSETPGRARKPKPVPMDRRSTPLFKTSLGSPQALPDNFLCPIRKKNRDFLYGRPGFPLQKGTPFTM